jgi:hypothetical protein
VNSEDVRFLISFLFTGGLLAGYVIFLVAAWRGMKASESMAESLRKIADKQEPLPHA